MVIVERAMLAPACCMFTKTSEGPFIDLLREFDLDHAGRIYIKASYARELGAFAGLPSIDQLEAAETERDELRAKVEELEQENASLREFEQAAEYTLQHFDGRVKRKPGPRPKQPA